MIGPRSIIAITIASLFLIGWGALTYYRHANDNLKAKVAIVEGQAKASEAAVTQVDHYVTETKIIREKADAQVEIVQASPGAQTSLPDGLRTDWAAGIDRMRHDLPASANPGPRDVSGRLPGS